MTDRIDSAHNPRIKAAARLRSRRDRRKAELILIDGVRELRRALEAGVAIIEAFVSDDSAATTESEALHCALNDGGVRVSCTAPAAHAKISYGARADGVVAVARRPQIAFDRLRLPPDPLIAVVDRVEKPGNLGAILRSADAAGVHCVIASDARGDIYGPNAIRASLGAIFTVPVIEASAADALAFLGTLNCRILTATPDGDKCYSEVSFSGPTAIVVGAEDQGVGDAWRKAPCERITLPMRGRVDSLNVSATAAVLFYEALRRREPPPGRA